MKLEEKIDVVEIMREIQNKADLKRMQNDKSVFYEINIETEEDRISKYGNADSGALIIDINPLLELEGEEFVNSVYRKVLLREPDEDGKISMLNLMNKCTKEEIIVTVLNSEEARNKNIWGIGFNNIKR